MNDKIQLAAMGEHMAEQAAQPMCMAKRIEELEAQVRVMAELLREGLDAGDPDNYYGYDLIRRISAALAGKMPAPVVPEGWKMVPVEPTDAMYDAGKAAGEGEIRSRWDKNGYEFGNPGSIYDAMLAAAPKPEAK